MKIIAYYLPQYYPFKENDLWWGDGFTEWTNVGKAKPLYRKHYQPKVPRDLGYYDLRLEEVREKQVGLAREAGVSGFCYWHYWFGNGRQLLDLPIKEVIDSGKPDFPFCLGWANESWKKKSWSHQVSESEDLVLMEQVYDGDQDIEEHFYSILPALKDPRYILVDDMPLFVIYKPYLIPDITSFFSKWNELARENGFSKGVFFVGHTLNSSEIEPLMKLGFSAVNVVRIGEHRFNPSVIRRIPFKLLLFKFFNRPLILNYRFISSYFIDPDDARDFVFPTLIPNWDHTPRSGNKGVVFHNSSPELFEKHVQSALEVIQNKPTERKVLFVKSWNEWGEGNYMEPDLRFGKGFINALASALVKFRDK